MICRNPPRANNTVFVELISALLNPPNPTALVMLTVSPAFTVLSPEFIPMIVVPIVIALPPPVPDEVAALPAVKEMD